MTTAKDNNELHPCPCCSARVLSRLGEYEICAVCGWEDDPVQSADPDYVGGANAMSLSQAKNVQNQKVTIVL